MEQYIIKYSDKNIHWQDIPSLSIDNLQWTDPCSISAEAKLLWTNEDLHLRLRAYEENIRAENDGELAMTHEDSCLEFFFQPLLNDPRYLNFEFNPNSALFLGIGSGRHDLVRLLPLAGNEIFQAQTKYFDQGWEITFKIPFEFIQRFFADFIPKSGLEFRGNFYKCGDLTVHPHFITWNKIERQDPDFHVPEFFGKLVFE